VRRLLLLLLATLPIAAEDEALRDLGAADAATRQKGAERLRSAAPGREDVVLGLAALLRHESPEVRLDAIGPLERFLVGYGGGIGGRAERRRKPGTLATKETEAAVERALAWLARFQSTHERGGDGRWEAKNFARGTLEGAGASMYDAGVTALALLAFLGAGYGDRGEHPYKTNVAEGLAFLVEVAQAEDGGIGLREDPRLVTTHAVATLALAEAWILTADVKWRDAAQRAVAFLEKARGNPGWGYDDGGKADTHTTGWALYALGVARLGALDVDPAAVESGFAWLDKMTEWNFGQTGYDYPGGASACYGKKDDEAGERAGLLLDRARWPWCFTAGTTALAVWCRILHSGEARFGELVKQGCAVCAERPPEWQVEHGKLDMFGKVDLCYWGYGALAFVARDGHKTPRSDATKWFKALRTALLAQQRPDGEYAGSWDPADAWGAAGGRVYSTAMAARALETEYLFGEMLHRVSRLPKAHQEAMAQLTKLAAADKDARVKERAAQAVSRVKALWTSR
jgi:hypothetical protein